MLNARSSVVFLTLLALLSGGVFAGSPEKAVGPRIDLERFTVDGIGLSSSTEDVLRAFGPPEEKEKYSPPEEEEYLDEDELDLEKREPETKIAKLSYSYFKKGIRVIFNEEDMSIYSMELFISELAPYEMFKGSFVQPIPLEVRDTQLLRPFAKQIYKDSEGYFYLKKDNNSPLRETAILSFDIDGWLSKITFIRAENFVIDIDNLCVAGVCLGAPGKQALERFGPPDKYNFKGKRYVAEWYREGLRIYARRKDGKIYQIIIFLNRFDGGFVQPLVMADRKLKFHDYLKGRIYQEGSNRICAYKKGEPLSLQKLVLKFDEDERVRYIFLDTEKNVESDLNNMVIAGVRIGDTALQMRRRLGTYSKWRARGDGFALAYPRYGIRVLMEKTPKWEERKKDDRERTVRWSEMGKVKRIAIKINDCRGLYSVPFALAEKMKDYEREADDRVFRRKGDTLYLSADGRVPVEGLVALVDFERIGWPKGITIREFQNIVVDMEAFTVAGIGLGTNADEVLRILGQPEKAHAIKDRDLSVFQYLDKGLIVIIDRKDRNVAKIIIDMDTFAGAFKQNLTLDSFADEYEKVLYREIYKQSERVLWLTQDGKKPTWKEAEVHFALTGRVHKIVFQTLAVKKAGIIYEITRELE